MSERPKIAQNLSVDSPVEETFASPEDAMDIHIEEVYRWLSAHGIPEPILRAALLDALNRLDILKEDEPGVLRPRLQAPVEEIGFGPDARGDFHARKLLDGLRRGMHVSASQRHQLMQLLRDAARS